MLHCGVPLPVVAVLQGEFDADVEVGVEHVVVAAGGRPDGILAHALVAGLGRLDHAGIPVDAVIGVPALGDAELGVEGPDIVARRVIDAVLAGGHVGAQGDGSVKGVAGPLGPKHVGGAQGEIRGPVHRGRTHGPEAVQLVVDIAGHKGDLHPLPGAEAQFEYINRLLHGARAHAVVVLDAVLVPVGEVERVEEHALGHDGAAADGRVDRRAAGALHLLPARRLIRGQRLGARQCGQEQAARQYFLHFPVVHPFLPLLMVA